eukprot:TRINITY_DN1824_c1_g1_i3.p1 TRINITY_DN1824_c1_g1~~TRINITY_DN1824_c1_g1_i3.p1  ORF type:complete len:125 (+),score=7.93 TRINITY_DN1824_c1_g1_i3:272-646(+)
MSIKGQSGGCRAAPRMVVDSTQECRLMVGTRWMKMDVCSNPAGVERCVDKCVYSSCSSGPSGADITAEVFSLVLVYWQNHVKERVVDSPSRLGGGSCCSFAAIYDHTSCCKCGTRKNVNNDFLM